MAILGKYDQQPAEVMDYPIDYTDWYDNRSDGPHLTTPLEVVVPVGVTLVGSTMTGKVANIVLSGVAEGATHKITVRHRTTAGIIKEAEFLVTGKDD